MYYKINVSKKGQHLFATAENSITSSNILKQVYLKFVEIFPKEKGYKITVTQYSIVGKVVDISTIVLGDTSHG